MFVIVCSRHLGMRGAPNARPTRSRDVRGRCCQRRRSGYADLLSWQLASSALFLLPLPSRIQLAFQVLLFHHTAIMSLSAQHQMNVAVFRLLAGLDVVHNVPKEQRKRYWDEMAADAVRTHVHFIFTVTNIP